LSDYKESFDLKRRIITSSAKMAISWITSIFHREIDSRVVTRSNDAAPFCSICGAGEC